jgi:hypothetical protein
VLLIYFTPDRKACALRLGFHLRTAASTHSSIPVTKLLSSEAKTTQRLRFRTADPRAPSQSGSQSPRQIPGIALSVSPSLPGADTINFHDPRNQIGIIRPPVVELTGENTDQVVVGVQKGTLRIFPAYLQHSVDANRSEQERVSVSFNIKFSGFTEQLSQPLW